jgi:hydrogenase maturation protease
VILVVGLGHPDRGDDAIGLLVAESVGDRLPEGCACLAWAGDPSGLLSRPEWAQAELAIIVDAALTGAPVGTVWQIDPAAEPLPTTRAASSHALGLEDLIALSHLIDAGPTRIVIFAVEGGRFGLGDEPSPEVREAVDAVSTLVLLEIAGASRAAGV